MFSACMRFLVLSPVISIEFAVMNFAVPIYFVTLFFLYRKSIPLVSSSTIPDFFFNNFVKSNLTSLQVIPHSLLPFNLTAFSYCSDA